MGEVPKICVLDNGFDLSLRGDGFQRRVPTTFSRDIGWPGVPPTPTPDLDVLVWMGTHATIPLATPGISGLLRSVRDET